MDIYDEILKEYYCENSGKNFSEIQNDLLIKFLNKFSNKRDDLLMKNGIILILALSSDIILDNFHLECKSITELESNEKNEVIGILKSEFNHRNNNYNNVQIGKDAENKNLSKY